MKREEVAFSQQSRGRGQVPPITGMGLCTGPGCCFISWSKSSMGSGDQHRTQMGKFVLSCISSSPPCAAVLRMVREEVGVGPRGARAQGGIRGSAGLGAPMGCCNDPHNLPQGGKRGAGRKSEHHGSCPARTLVVSHPGGALTEEDRDQPSSLTLTRSSSPCIYLHISTCLPECAL